MRRGVAFNTSDGGIVRRRRRVDLETGWAEGLGVQSQNARGAKAAERAAVADLVDQQPVNRSAVAAHRRDAGIGDFRLNHRSRRWNCEGMEDDCMQETREMAVTSF